MKWVWSCQESHPVQIKEIPGESAVQESHPVQIKEAVNLEEAEPRDKDGFLFGS